MPDRTRLHESLIAQVMFSVMERGNETNVNQPFKAKIFLQTQSKKDLSMKTSYLAIFFNVFYYTALIPFKTVLEEQSNQYILKTSLLQQVNKYWINLIKCSYFHYSILLFQQIVCGIVHIGAVLFLAGFGVHDIFKIRSDDASSIVVIFDFGSNLGTAFAAMFLLYILWTRRNDYLDVINHTSSGCLTKRKQVETRMKVIANNLILYQFSRKYIESIT